MFTVAQSRFIGVCAECGGLVLLDACSTRWYHADFTTDGHDVPWPNPNLVIVTQAGG